MSHLFFDSTAKEKATKDVGSSSGFRFPWPKVFGSLNHEVKSELGCCGEQNKENTHLPVAGGINTINFDDREEGGDAVARREGSAEGTAPAPH